MSPRGCLPEDLGRLVVRRPDGAADKRRWPQLALYARNVPLAIRWIRQARQRQPKHRAYYWIERLGAPAFRPPTTKNPKELV